MPRLSPRFADWVKNKMPISPSVRLEFYNRLENLCEIDIPMTAALRAALTKWIGDDKTALTFIRIIEAFDTTSRPRLPNNQAIRGDEVKNKLARLIPREFYLEFLRLFDRQCAAMRCYTFTLTAIDPDNSFIAQFTINGTAWNTIQTNLTPIAFSSPNALEGLYTELKESGADADTTVELVVDGNDVTITINSTDDIPAVAYYTDTTTTPSIYQNHKMFANCTCDGFCDTINDLDDLPVDNSGCPSGVIQYIDLVDPTQSSPYVWNSDTETWDRVWEATLLTPNHDAMEGVLLEGWELATNFISSTYELGNRPSSWRYRTPAELLAGIDDGLGGMIPTADFSLAFRNASGCVFELEQTIEAGACGVLCATIVDESELPVDSSGCPSGFIPLTAEAPDYTRSLYRWIVDEWVKVVDIVPGAVYDDEGDFYFETITITINGNYSVLFDEVLYTETIILEDVLATDRTYTPLITDLFTLCEYALDQVAYSPPPPATCEHSSGAIDTGDGGFFITGSINGVAMDGTEATAELAISNYIDTTFGFTPQSVTVDWGSLPIMTITAIRLDTDAVITDFGVFSSPNAIPPIVDQAMPSVSDTCNP